MTIVEQQRLAFELSQLCDIELYHDEGARQCWEQAPFLNSYFANNVQLGDATQLVDISKW
jgi:hypothetical protein